MRILATSVVCVLMMASCSSSNDEGQLTDVTWVLDADSMASLVEGPPAGARVDLLMTDGAASGTSGCNSYNGSYTLDGDELTFGPFAGTQMACDEPTMDLEAAYLSALAATNGFEIGDDGSTLVLTGDTDLSFTAG